LTPADAKDPGFIKMEISAPFYNDPAPDGAPGPFFQLWDYEVVEAFFLASGGQVSSATRFDKILKFGKKLSPTFMCTEGLFLDVLQIERLSWLGSVPGFEKLKEFLNFWTHVKNVLRKFCNFWTEFF
jgi:hypothetical protein